MADSSGDGISKRRLRIPSVVLSVGVLVAAGLFGVGVQAAKAPLWTAHADPATPTPFTPPHDCGSPGDHGTRDELWTAIKDAKPGDTSPSLLLVTESWVLKDGDSKGGPKNRYNLLALPRARVTGVECPEIWGPKAFNLWAPAWQEATTRFKSGVDIALGINSKPGRKQDQLHIHLAVLQQQARRDLDKLKGIPTDLSKWNTSLFTVMGNVYRIARVNDLNTNVFKLLKDNVSQNDMFEQSIVVVAATGGKGFYILNTQGQPKLPNEPQHNPQLKLNGEWGTEAIDQLLWNDPIK
jgi:CDP-diacylglycerol pyrophosphatase